MKNAYCQTLNREFKSFFLTTKCANAAKVRDYRFAKLKNRTFPGTSLARVISPARRASLFSAAMSAEENVCVHLRPSAVNTNFVAPSVPSIMALSILLSLQLFEILHNANAKDIASRTRAICSADRVVIKAPILPFLAQISWIRMTGRYDLDSVGDI